MVVGTFVGVAIGGRGCRRRCGSASILVACIRLVPVSGISLGFQSTDTVLLLDDDCFQLAYFVLDVSQILFLKGCQV